MIAVRLICPGYARESGAEPRRPVVGLDHSTTLELLLTSPLWKVNVSWMLPARAHAQAGKRQPVVKLVMD
jgi:hypothetical protein